MSSVYEKIYEILSPAELKKFNISSPLDLATRRLKLADYIKIRNYAIIKFLKLNKNRYSSKHKLIIATTEEFCLSYYTIRKIADKIWQKI